MDAAVIALLRQKHAEYLRREAVAHGNAAGTSDPGEKKVWRDLAQSWRELAAHVETVIAERLKSSGS
jgi:N-acetyl-anhydromuramyl-L-alanine amidase AmpD